MTQPSPPESDSFKQPTPSGAEPHPSPLTPAPSAWWDVDQSAAELSGFGSSPLGLSPSAPQSTVPSQNQSHAWDDAPFPPFVADLPPPHPSGSTPRSATHRSRLVPAIDNPESRVLGVYHLLREIGRGGMGVVYEASESQLGRRVALKILPFTASSDSRLIDRLHHEAQIVARLNHPHIVTVYGSGESEGVHYIAFQLVDGQSLDKSLRISFVGSNSPAPPTDKRPPAPPKIHWRWIATIGRDVAGALQHAHENGIIHRDIKPSNLLLDSTGKIWVTDFGLAMASDMSNLTATGDVLGTLRYMSPEQATGQRGVVDRRTDVYSLGITLYEMATGKPAFAGLSRAALLKHILFDTPPPIRQLVSSIPRDLATIIGKATAKLPSERYYTAGELAADLRRYLDGQPIVAQPPTLADRARHFATRYRIPLMIAITSAFLLLAAWSVISQQIGRASCRERV